MRIRTQLVLAFVALTLFTAVGVSVSMEFDLSDLASDSLDAAERGIHGVTRANYDLSRDILTAYGEKIVEMKARAVAKELSLLLGGREFHDYNAMRRDDKLRRIATQDIYGWRPGEVKQVAGYVDLLDNRGVAVLHPNPKVEGRNFREWEKLFPHMWALVKRSFSEKEVKGYYRFFDKNSGKYARKYMVLEQVPNTPFILVAAVVIDAYFRPVHRMIQQAGDRNLSAADKNIQERIARARRRISELGLIVGLAVLAVALVLAVGFARSISGPILRLEEGVQRIGQGDFSAAVEAKGCRETVELGKAFNRLGEQLTEHVERLQREAQARQAVESELRIAGEIQRSLLPRTFPPFPERHELDLYATVAPAREVAGDFYDFFFVDRDTLALLVADVSGKGMPAALMMTATRTLLRNVCHRRSDPALAMAETNDVLCQDNEKCMFVTIILGYYNVASGRLAYINGGHNDPVLISADGARRPVSCERGIPLGIEPGEVYPPNEIQLEDGDLLTLYTDGVTEATAPDRSLFGLERFVRLLRERALEPLEDLSADVLRILDDYQQGRQYDDITLVTLRRHAPDEGA